MTTVGVLQARVSSSRLPGKVLADVSGAPMIARQIERIMRARRLDMLILATSEATDDGSLAALGEKIGIPVFRGSLNDVLGRFAGAVAAFAPDAETVVRLTGDCPLTDPDVIDLCIEAHRSSAADITTNAAEPTYPDGLDVEVIARAALEVAANEACASHEREHVTQFIYQRPDRFRVAHVKQARDLSALRWTVDHPDDLAFVRRVYDALYAKNPAFGMEDVMDLITENPEMAAINASYERNEGLKHSLSGTASDVEQG